MTNGRYILDENKKTIPCEDLLKWATWFEKADRNVAKIKIGGVEISTVFLGLDHNALGDKPQLFETMIFGGKLDGEMWRYSTWDEAVEGHKKAIKKVKESL